MGTVTADVSITMDGVYQAPGGPEEDNSGSFGQGGWQAPYADAESGAHITGGIEHIDALLLGRKTYGIFAAYWPHQQGTIAEVLNQRPKFVVSQTLVDPSWAETTVLTDSAAVRTLTGRFDDVRVIGSGALVRSLIAADVLDRLNLYLYPVVLGTGKRLFEDAVPSAFRLVIPPITFPKGAVLLEYERAGSPVVGLTIDG
jgi:dihydrofolate reductase